MNIQQYVTSFVDKLHKPDKINVIDLVLDGSVGTAPATLGIMHYLSALGSRKYIHVDKISCSNIGSFIAMAYIGNSLDAFTNIFYKTIRKKFKNNQDLVGFSDLLKKTIPLLPTNIHHLMTNRVFISYYNLETGKKHVKSKFKSIDDVTETILKACSIPFVVNGSMGYKNKYIDGFSPHIFPPSSFQQTLYLNMYSYDKLSYSTKLTNRTYYLRQILSGIVDADSFFANNHNQSTYMCSYVQNWSAFIYLHLFIKRILEWHLYYLLRPIVILSTYTKPITNTLAQLSTLIRNDLGCVTGCKASACL
jgi:hypothetical protein